MAFDPLDTGTWMAFLLIFARMAAMVFLFPFFRYRGVPILLRVWIAIIISFLLFMTLGGDQDPFSTDVANMTMALISEVLIGLALGFLILLFFSIFTMSGELISRQAGLMFSRVFDPTFESQVNVLGQFYSIFALVFYLTINGHHLLLRSLTESYRLIPLGVGLFVPELTGGVVRLSADVLLISFKISAPIIFVLLTVNIALGLVAKTVPQVHIFLEALPFKILLTMVLVALLLPLMGSMLPTLLDWFVGIFHKVMQGWA